MTVYHETATPTVAIDRLRAELRRLVASLDTTMLQIGHRALAAAIGCSASRIPTLMQRLEDAGEIVRHAWKNGFVIDAAPLIDHPPAAEPAIAAPLIDQPSAESALALAAAPDRPHDRDRVKTGCMEDHDSKTQEKEIARPLFERLLAQPGMSRSLALRIATHPIGTLADFLQDLRLAQSIPAIHSPFFFTVAKWRDSQRVIAPEESHHAHPARSATASGTRRRTRTNQSTPCTNPTTDADYAALLAEIRAARPLTAEELGLPVPGQRGAAYGS